MTDEEPVSKKYLADTNIVIYILKGVEGAGIPLMAPKASWSKGRLAGVAGRGRIDYKWMVLSVTTLGALLAAIGSSIVILALPSIMVDLRTNLVMGPLGGYISDLRGARWPATAGLVLQGLATFVLSQLAPRSGYDLFLTGIILMGLGGGLFWSPNTSAVMGSAPRLRLGVASATLATLRQCGMVVSFALALAVAAASMPFAVMARVFLGTAGSLGGSVMAAFAQGMDQALRVSTVIVFVAALFTWQANDRAGNRPGREDT